MPRRNTRQHASQARRKADGTRAVHLPPPPPVESLVLPKGRCFRNPSKPKLQFTQDDAPRALAQAQANRRHRGTGHMEKRFYECKIEDGGCGFYHLSSREFFEDRKTQ